jgi:osmotically-inducible protein OsmY
MSILAILLAVLGGAGLMYILDPQGGRRRRALVRDQAVKVLNRTGDNLSGLSKDLKNRAQGVVAETTSRLEKKEEPTDETLVARVRAKMGRIVSHPSAVEVLVNDGTVTLSGAILATEVQPLLRAVKSIAGVRAVENQLRLYNDASQIPSLQGGVTRTELR